MKFFVSLFAAGAVAVSIARDVQTIQDAVSSISDATTALNTAVQGFSGDIAGLQSASEAVIEAINAGNAAVEPTSEISLADALSLQGPIEDLGDLVGQTVDNAIAKKGDFASAGIGAVVLDQLQQQRDAATTFAETVTSKVPEAAQGIAAELSKPILDALNRGVQEFSDQTGSPSSSAGGSSTAAPTPSGSSSPTATHGGPSVTPPPAGSPTATPPPFTGAAPRHTAAAGLAMAGLALVAAL